MGGRSGSVPGRLGQAEIKRRELSGDVRPSSGQVTGMGPGPPQVVEGWKILDGQLRGRRSTLGQGRMAMTVSIKGQRGIILPMPEKRSAGCCTATASRYCHRLPPLCTPLTIWRLHLETFDTFDPRPSTPTSTLLSGKNELNNISWEESNQC